LLQNVQQLTDIKNLQINDYRGYGFWAMILIKNMKARKGKVIPVTGREGP
jgi:hypothetical protein